MRLLLLSITILSCWAAELPQDVQAAINKAEAAKVKIDQALIKDLTKLQETYTKKGNLDAANGIKAKVDEVTKGLPDLLDDKAKEAKYVTVFSEENYKGASAVVKLVGTVVSCFDMDFPNDNLRSILVPVGVTVTVFDNTGGDGKSTTYTESSPNTIDGAFMSSLRVNKVRK
jgi:hypothetical protein